VHDCAPAGPAAPSPGLLRLGDWLAGRARHPYPAVVREMLRRGLGEERWRRVTDWYRAILADPKVTLAHGAPGLGALVIGGEVGASDLLTGEDLAAQPWYVDLGWVVGELAELKWQAGGDTAAWQALTDALFDGYGRDLGDTWHRMVVLRILLHSHDFAAYAGGLGDWVDRYAGFLIYLVDLS
jgi:phosphopantothenoylcysteine decarboxylase/phosphopantothenate--cysteine ligase